MPALQVFPLQQPLAQLVASQTHVPEEQRWPVAQAAPPLHRHMPLAEQLSAVMPHAVHAAAEVPHAPVVGGLVQAVPVQHPEGQLVASHTQLPLTQWLPAAQIAPPPQRQVPAALHASARTGSQALHAAPPVPHRAAVAGFTQVAPLQQPAAQLAALQPLHACAVQVPAPQDAHAAPFFPHSVAAVPALHWPVASQQPVAQLVASHTQTPPEQRWPTAHTAPVPHAHAPAVQRSDRVSHAVHIAPAAPQVAAV